MPPQSGVGESSGEPWVASTNSIESKQTNAQSTVNSTANLVDETGVDYLCGVLTYRPQWLQTFAHPRWYFVNFILMGILSGAIKTYLVGILSTVERRFQMSNSTTAFILIADNVAPIIINIIAGYYANRISRPKLMSIGSFIVVIGCLCSMLPFFIYGPGVTGLMLEQSKVDEQLQLCHDDQTDALRRSGQCAHTNASVLWIPFLLFLTANFLNGVGGSVYFVVGSTYMDDNIKKKNSPLYFSLMFALRLLGPVLGYLTSSLCLTYYEDIFNGPPNGLNSKDPRWIGAWWLGYVGFSISLSFVALPMMLFPRILPMGRDQKANKILEKKTGSGAVKDIYLSVGRLMENPIFTLKTLGFIFIIIGTAGYGTSFSKYMEHQFGKSPSSASFLSGTSKVLTNMFGLMAGGLFLQWIRPSAKKTAGFVAAVEVIFLLGYVWLMFIGCHTTKIEGFNDKIRIESEKPSFHMENRCNERCDCSPKDFLPVCSPNGKTFYSPCYAGCQQKIPSVKGSPIQYKNCTCVEPSHVDFSATVESGYCGKECQTLTLYLIIVILCQLIGSTGRSGSMLIYLRCVDPTDKSMALGTSSSLINLFAFIPYPVIYGYVLDSSCMLWGQTCEGKRGSCRLYDKDKLRIRLHSVTIGFLVMAVICYIGVVFFADRIKHFYDEPDDDVDPPEKQGADGKPRDLDTKV